MQMLPGSAQRLQACGDVDSVAVQCTALFDHIPQIDADAKLHAPVLGQLRVAAAQLLLDLDRTLDSLDRTGELGKQRVARGIDHAAIVRPDMLANDLTVCVEGLDRGALVVRHQPGVGGHISGENGGELAVRAHGVLCGPARGNRTPEGPGEWGRGAAGSLNQYPNRIVMIPGWAEARDG
jgi:hypothetical protein